jgi:L-threonylcarbamoyladenylate synthase
METKFIKLDAGKPNLEIIKQAAGLVDSGGLVVFPTETVYGVACRVSHESIKRLSEAKGRTAEKFYTLHIGQKSDLKKYVPNPTTQASQLVSKGWPGPLTIVFELDDKDIAKVRNDLGEEVFTLLYHDNTIGIRCPDNVIASCLLTHTRHPVVAPSANITGNAPSVSGEQAMTAMDGKVDMVLEGGSCKYQKSSTVVKVDRGGVHLIREGLYDKRDVEAMSRVHILFVCTGNTCRSPMAAGLCRKILAQKFGCSVDHLNKMGYDVTSAGTMAVPGWQASVEAIEVCKAKGVDISGHRSRQLSHTVIEQSDYIFVMTGQHRKAVVELVGGASERCLLLGSRDIPDPVGGTERDYYYCAELIEKALLEKVSGLIR